MDRQPVRLTFREKINADLRAELTEALTLRIGPRGQIAQQDLDVIAEMANVLQTKHARAVAAWLRGDWLDER